MPTMPSIVLMGIKACGKSSLAPLIANQLALPFFDSDHALTHLFKQSVRELYLQGGKAGFMQHEAHIIRQLFAKHDSFVLASGGGICDNPAALKAIPTTALKVFLNTPEEILFQRLYDAYTQNKTFPAYLPQEPEKTAVAFSALYTRRQKCYQHLADIEQTIIASNDLSDIAHAVVKKLQHRISLCSN